MSQDREEKKDAGKTPEGTARPAGFLSGLPERYRRILRTAGGIFFVLYFLVAILFIGTRYLILPQVASYKTKIEAAASDALGSPVAVSRLSASWHGLQPRIDLENVSISDDDGDPLISLDHVSATVSWWSLPMMELRLSSLEVDRPDIRISRDAKGIFYVAGKAIDPDEKSDGSGADWVLKQARIVIRDGTLHWRDEYGRSAQADLEKVNFVLENSRGEHRFRLQAAPRQPLARAIDIQAVLNHPQFGRQHEDFSEWKGHLYAEISDFDLAEWRKLAPIPEDAGGAGRGSVNVWADFDAMQLTSVQADVDGENFRIKTGGEIPYLDIKRIKGRVSVDRKTPEDGREGAAPAYLFSVKEASVETAGGKHLTDATVSAEFTPGENMASSMKITVGSLDLRELKQFLPHVPLDKALSSEIARYQAAGKLSNFYIAWNRPAGGTLSYNVKGAFSGLTLKEVAPAPAGSKPLLPAHLGIENLTGSLSAGMQEGTLTLNSEQTVLYTPFFPDTPHKFDTLSAQVRWERPDDKALSVELQEFSFSQNSMRLKASGRYENNSETNPIGTVDATVDVNGLNVADVRKFVPVQTKKTLYEWLTNALKGGTVNNAKIRLRGKLTDFPYTDGRSDGEFTVRAPLADSILNYAPTSFAAGGKRPLWPVIEKIQGEYRMDGGRIVIHADTAMTNNVLLKDVDVIIPDSLIEDPYLDIKGTAEGTMQNLVGFVNLSPVAEWISDLTEKTTATGDGSVILQMKLPLTKLEDSTVNGSLQFKENDIVLLEDLPVITKTQGMLYFTEKGFTLDKLKGIFMSEPVSVSGGTKPNGRFLVRAESVLSGKGLQQTYTSGVMGQLVKYASGSTPYVVTIETGSIKIESALKGLKISLPAPLYKAAETELPLSVVIRDRPSSGRTFQDELDVSLGSGMGAVYYRQKEKGGIWRVSQGGIGIFHEPEPKAGMSLDIRVKSFDFNEWKNTLTDILSGTGSSSSSGSGSALVQYLLPHSYSLASEELLAMDLMMTDVKLNGTHYKSAWEFDVRSDQVNGRMKWTESSDNEAGGRLDARLKSLNVLQSSLKKGTDMSGRSDIYRIPALDIVADDMTLFGLHLGKTEIVANNVQQRRSREWRIDKLRVSNPAGTLDATGSWIAFPSGSQQTQLKFDLNISNAGKLLKRMGYEGVFSKGNGEMKGNLSWNNYPFKLDLPTLSGDFSLKVEDGQFLKVEPGAAKLLNVISLQSIPHRLSLDFSDVFAKGFAFDEITANAEISNGVMKTENFKMKGVSAAVMMDGSVDIVKETQNLHLVVIPSVDAAGASIAYGFINPAIGIGTFLAQLVLKNPLMKQLTHEYQITGTWTNPAFAEIKSAVPKKSTEKEHTDTLEKEDRS